MIKQKLHFPENLKNMLKRKIYTPSQRPVSVEVSPILSMLLSRQARSRQFGALGSGEEDSGKAWPGPGDVEPRFASLYPKAKQP